MPQCLASWIAARPTPPVAAWMRIDWPGWIHSNNMHVTEKLTRTGNALKWEAIVDDPDTLLEPFHVEPRTVRLNPNAKATLTEDLPCEERDSQHIVTHERG